MTLLEHTPPPTGGFAALGLEPQLQRALTTLGYEEPTPIQREAIPHLLGGRDLLGQAGTGTGKTAAFALPILQRLPGGPPRANRPQALVLVPTRELAMQVAEAIHRYGREKGTSVLPIYGGQSMGQQLRALSRGVQVVVATPGRALDHLRRGTLVLDELTMVVLDEADEMLDMGFAEDMEAILERTPAERSTALFSATLNPRILKIAESHLRDPVRVTIARERPVEGELPRVRQLAYVVSRSHKHQALGRVLDMESPTSALVFCRTRLEVDELTEAMNAHGYRAEALHGGFAQEHRDRVMKRFRAERIDLLIATDVAARGLDIEHLSHVVNYDVPTDADTYVHRIGRTGRAGREGVAITLLEPREHRLLRAIEKGTRQKIAISEIPSVADLHRKRLESTRASLRGAVQAGELDSYRAMVVELASELDPLDIAAAAVKLAHEAAHAEGETRSVEQELPSVELPEQRKQERGGWNGKPRGKTLRPFVQTEREPRRGRADRARLFVASGRADGLRPGDLVGAIANEAGVPGAEIGPIRIAERFALVEVPAERAAQILSAMRSTTIRGRRVRMRRDREEAE